MVRRSRRWIEKQLRIRIVFGLVALVGATARNADAALMHNMNVTPESAYLEYADMFPSVGWMSSSIGGVEAGFSSGVLIDPHWVLTSGHGVLQVDSNPNSFRDSYQVGFGSNFFSDPGESRFASEVFLHPNYVGVENGPDLALLYFVDPFVTVSAASLYTGPDTVGSTYDLVGYGIPGTPATGLQEADRERRAGSNKLNSARAHGGIYLSATFRQPGHPDFSSLGIQGTRGDSGGGWFVNGLLAGISSDATSPRYGGSTTATRVSLELDWISEVQASHTAVPEPTSAALLLGIAGLGAAVRALTSSRELRKRSTGA